MPVETSTQSEQPASEHVPPSAELQAEEALRAEAVEQIRLKRRFKIHTIVIGT